MKKNILLFAVLTVLVVLAACDSSTSSDSDVAERKLFVDTMSELPGCTESKEGFVVYVIEDEDTVVCVSGVWRIVGMNAGIESSSGIAGKSSSSYSPVEMSSTMLSSSSSAMPPVNSSSSLVNESSSSSKVSVTRLTMTDSRDKRVYRSVAIGEQVWMAENMNYDGAEIDGASSYLGWCYKNEETYCDKYGRLYNWKTAKDICPEGWHLPSLEEWNVLVATVGDSLTAGGLLKSTDSWMELTSDAVSVNGLDLYGFAALPAGFRKEDYSDGRYFDIEKFANFWTSSVNGESDAYHITMRYDSEKVSVIVDPMEYALSVRCLKN
ncbi:fibrobacter succinogenes major paralogous domain-containing protein [uncultured Fibrobacter sp.]|uniref:fibrobacter succinogenes major paralogous domain-containing protein n=1 Tax=uncultured Fibrobacter sp. TaxID=261512 RepID=UPI00261D4C7B|nr:fibrobacter succinogenes major paralogous domain-containing protein [uncultured Fibrobacter sp.]